MCQCIFVQVMDIVLSSMIVKMVIDKSKIIALNIALFPKNSQIGIIGQHFINAVHQGI